MLAPGAIVTDVGSVKQSVIRDVAPHIPDGVDFVPGHPIAGTEYSGPDAALPAAKPADGAPAQTPVHKSAALP